VFILKLLKSISRYFKEWAQRIREFFLTCLKPSIYIRIENIELRGQLAQLKHDVDCGKKPRPKVTTAFRHFMVLLYKYYPDWKTHLAIVKPDTVVKWHRQLYRFIWKLISKPGRPPISKAVYRQTKEIVEKNPGSSAEKIHDIMANLGISDAPCANTIRKYFPSTRRPPDQKRKELYSPKRSQNWWNFIYNHLDVSWSMDFFTIPSLTFRILYGLVIINHGNRKIEHFAVTTNPTSEWTKQQIRNATPFGHQPKYLIHDNDSIFTAKEVQDFLAASGIKAKTTSRKAPWQNPYVERVIGTIRRELLNYIIPLNEKHLHKLLKEYVDYYNHHRPHQGLSGGTPVPSPEYQPSNCANTKLKATPVLGGLYHSYTKVA